MGLILMAYMTIFFLQRLGEQAFSLEPDTYTHISLA